MASQALPPICKIASLALQENHTNSRSTRLNCHLLSPLRGTFLSMLVFRNREALKYQSNLKYFVNTLIKYTQDANHIKIRVPQLPIDNYIADSRCKPTLNATFFVSTTTAQLSTEDHHSSTRVDS